MTGTVLHIDWTRCRGHGACIELMAGGLEADEWGYPSAIGVAPRHRTSIPLAADDVAAAEDAVDLCPVQALSIRASRER